MEKEIEIVIDVETTGLDYTKERIIEFAAVKLENGVIVDKFETLINPHQHIRKSSQAVHGISEEMLEIVFGNRVFDWGDTVYCPELRDGQFSAMMKNNKRDIASIAAKQEKLMTKKISDAIAAFEELNH